MLVSDRIIALDGEVLVAGLNPCFSGCWSRTFEEKTFVYFLDVLILVLVDVGLGQMETCVNDPHVSGLLPTRPGA